MFTVLAQSPFGDGRATAQALQFDLHEAGESGGLVRDLGHVDHLGVIA